MTLQLATGFRVQSKPKNLNNNMCCLETHVLSEVSIVATPAGKPGFFGFVRFGFVGFVRFVRFGCSVVFFIGFIMSIYIKIAPDRIGFKCFKTRAGRNHTHCACGFFPPGSCVNVFYSSMAKLQHFQSGIVCPDKE